jgi:hypothetical protein
VLATRAEESDTSGQFGLILCNAIGTPVDSMYYICNSEWYLFIVSLKHPLIVLIAVLSTADKWFPIPFSGVFSKVHYSKFEL